MSFLPVTHEVKLRPCLINSRLSFGLSFSNLFNFSLSPEPLCQFEPKLEQSILGIKWIQVCSNSSKGGNSDIVKIHYEFKRSLFLKPIGQFQWTMVQSISQGHGIHVCSNEVRGNSGEKVKILLLYRTNLNRIIR